MRRQSFTILFNHDIQTVYFPGGEEFFGLHPWDVSHPDCQSMVKTSFEKCMVTKEPQFHVVKLSDRKNARFPDTSCCVWLSPVDLRSKCAMPCVAIMAKCVIVPEEFHLLTVREREVLAKLASGCSQNEIALEWVVARSTIDTLLARVRKKFEDHSGEAIDTLEIAVWATTYRDILELDAKTCSDHLHKK